MRDYKIEQWLNSIPVEFEYFESVNIDDINFDDSTRNSAQVRFELIDDKNIENMMAARMANHEMNAIILNLTENGFDLLDGNHRIESAIRCGLETHDAYVVEIESGTDLELRLMLEPNSTLVGKELAHEEKVRWAIYLLTNSKITQAEVAKQVNLTNGEVSTAWRLHEASTRASTLLARDRRSYNAWDALNDTSKLTLDRIRSDNAWKAALEAVMTLQLSTTPIRELISEVRKNKTEEGQLEAIKAYIQKLKDANKPKPNANKRALDYMKMHLGAINNVDVAVIRKEAANGTLTDEQRKDLIKFLNASETKIAQVRKFLASQSGSAAVANRAKARSVVTNKARKTRNS